MKLGHFDRGLRSCGAGGGVHARSLVQALAQLGAEILTPFAPSDLEIPGLRRYPPEPSSVLRIAAACDAMYIRAGYHRVDTFTAAKLLFPGKPFVWEINTVPEELDVAGWSRFRRTKARLGRAVLRRFVDGAICVSDVLARHAREDLGIGRVSVVINGAPAREARAREISSFYSRRVAGGNVFVWAGSTQYPWQGLERILCAAARLSNDPGLLFLLVGDFQDLDLPANVVVHPGVEHSQVYALLRGATAGLCVYGDYSWTPRGFYGSPLKLFDYMAAGIPVIGSDLGQIGQVIRERGCGYLVGDSPDDLVQALTDCAADVAEAGERGERGRRAVLEYYNWERAARETLDFIATLM